MSEPVFDGRIVTFLAADTVEGLRRWRQARGLSLRLPVDPWRATNGFTEAELAALIVTRGTSSWKIILKVCPPSTPEPAAHADAWDDTPAFARDHLVELPFDPWPTPSQRILLFQGIAGDDDHFATRPLSALEEPARTEAASVVAVALLTAWNDGRARSVRRSVPSFLRDEIGPVVEAWGSVRRWAGRTALLHDQPPWILLPGEDAPVPNPVLSVAGGGPLAGLEIDALMGRAHRDLHLENALVPGIGAGRPDPDRFRLVDLATYSPSASLTVDPVMLALSLAARRLADLDADGRADLLGGLASVPGAGSSEEGVAAAVHEAVVAGMGSRRRDWSHQWLLSILARSLLFTTFERLAPGERWWFFRLAARAAAVFLHERAPEARAGPAVEVHNPFRERRARVFRSGDGRPPLSLGPGGALGYEWGSDDR